MSPVDLNQVDAFEKADFLSSFIGLNMRYGEDIAGAAVLLLESERGALRQRILLS